MKAQIISLEIEDVTRNFERKVFTYGKTRFFEFQDSRPSDQFCDILNQKDRTNCRGSNLIWLQFSFSRRLVRENANRGFSFYTNGVLRDIVQRNGGRAANTQRHRAEGDQSI